MKIHRFCLPELKQSKLGVGSVFRIEDQQAVHQIKDVFRFEIGSIVQIFDGYDFEVQCKILLISKKNIELEVLKIIPNNETIQQNKNLVLSFALLKNDHTEMILEKCTELGVSNFQPLLTDRTIKTGFRKDRLEKIIKEATEQSGFTRLPQLHDPLKLKDFLESISKLKDIFVMDMEGEGINDIKDNLESKKDTIILIGPEGGWSGDERKLFRDLNLKTFSMGKQTLRAETACIASSALLNI